MNRLATLRLAARDLQARIFRSLPWKHRFAHAFTVLADKQMFRALGLALADTFKQRGIEPVNPKEIIDMVERMYKKLVQMSQDVIEAESAVSDFVSELCVNPDKLRQGVSAAGAMSYIRQGMLLKMKDKLRAKMRRQEDYFEDLEKTMGQAVDDPGAMDAFEDLVEKRGLQRLFQDANKIVPWGGAYLQEVMDGAKDNALIGNSSKGIPSQLAQELYGEDYLKTPGGEVMSLGNWSKPNGYKEKMRQLLMDYFNEIRDESLSSIPTL